MSSVRGNAPQLLTDCIVTLDSLKKNLADVERRIAEREQFTQSVDTRKEILRRLETLELDEDDLTLRWISLYADLLDWVEEE